MFCDQCGKTLLEQSQFCPHCGAPRAVAADTTSPAPVTPVASLDCPVAYAPVLEEAILPGSADVLKAIRTLAAY